MNRTKITHIARASIVKPATLLVILLMLGGCLKNLDGDRKKALTMEPVILTVTNAEGESTRANDVNDNGLTINNLWVLQLEAKDPRIIRHIAQGTPAEGSPGRFQVQLLTSSGGEKWNIMVAVNLTKNIDISFVGKPYTEFTSSQFGYFGSDQPITEQQVNKSPKVGMVYLNGSSDIGIGKFMGALSVGVLRPVAKVDIGVGTYNGDNNTWSNTGQNKIPFKLVTIQLRRAWANGRWFFNIDKLTFDPSIPAVKKASMHEVSAVMNTLEYSGTSIITETYCKNTIYQFEHPMSGTRYDADHGSRPCLIIGGKYGGSTEVTYYRIDFSGLDGGSKDFFTSDILRNHLYRITINSVSGPGQDTPDKADETVPENLTFTTAIAPWTMGAEDTPPQQIGYYMNYGGLNGSITETPETGPILTKTPTWKGRQPAKQFNYNTFYGEADNFWAHDPTKDPGTWNGDLYASANGEVNRPNYIFAALKTEGVYPTLMIASNNITDAAGVTEFPWKSGKKTLTAFDLCRSYNGGGYSDWRLPRLSELALMYANREALEDINGFEPFGTDAIYWSGSEYGTGKVDKSDSAWALKFSATGDPFLHDAKSSRHLIRCVRQP